MGDTAMDEFLGGSVDVTTGSDVKLRTPSGPGGARFYVIRPSAPMSAYLPDARLCKAGTKMVIANHGGGSNVTLRDNAGGSLGTIGPNQASQVILANNSTQAGDWIGRSSSATNGTALNASRVGFRLELYNGSSTGLVLREEIERVYDYDGSSPVSLTVILRDGIYGADSTSKAGFDSGAWPAGSTLLLGLNPTVRVLGRGGDGGRGGSISPALGLATAGSDGGPAMILRLNTALTNFGRIQGGGGGGAGHAYISPLGVGGGGGGGAGHKPSKGGLGGIMLPLGPPYPGSNGADGVIDIPGTGGAGPGGTGATGGGPGLAGGSLGVAGGAAGNSIRKLTGITLVKRVAGIITGPEVFF